MSAVDVAALVIRLWLAVVMLAHGVNHARTQEGTAEWFAKKGFRSAPLQARMAAGTEILIAGGLALGLLTTFAAAGLVATMFAAFWTVHRFAGFFVFKRPDEGWEYVATLSVAAVALAIIGPGSASVDSAIDIAGTFDGWVGAVIAIAGVAVSGGQLATFWKKPADG